ncbi:MAG TPA: divergent PAP2 family protein [Candidatus Saccharimonadales bacterium]|nr:divergent PAP2 family protein [Candidatus Saccharimonadales bacterium]
MADLINYLLPAGVAWALAHLIKFSLDQRKTKKFSLKVWYSTGNMPSAHTATAVALAVGFGVRLGVDAPLFAFSLMFAIVTAYDSMMARRATGEQGLALKKLLAKSPFAKDPPPHHALGHRPLEVLAGAGLGLISGWLVASFITF